MNIRAWVWRSKSRCVMLAKIGNGAEVYNSISHGRVLDVFFQPDGRFAFSVCRSGHFEFRVVRSPDGGGLLTSGFLLYGYPAKSPVAINLGAAILSNVLKSCTSLSYNRALGKLVVHQPGSLTPVRITVLFPRQALGHGNFPIKMFDSLTRSAGGGVASETRVWDIRILGHALALVFHSGVGGLRRLGIQVKKLGNAFSIASAIYAPRPVAKRQKISKASLKQKAIFERWAGLTDLRAAAAHPEKKGTAALRSTGGGRDGLGRGVPYDSGRNASRDYAKAMVRYRRAAAHGSAMAMADIANLFSNGQGVPRDYVKAAKWNLKAAALGNAIAETNLGILYVNGWGVPKDYVKAMAWNRKGAAAGIANAMLHIGVMYAKGQGVPKNYGKAMVWYRKAADAGAGSAMNNIGMLYAGGRGVPKSYAEAMNWWRKAVAVGYAPAMTNIGVMYFAGRGAPKNISKATEWFKKAAAAGDPRAKQALGELKELAPATMQK